MTVYVDPLAYWGWTLRGHPVENCHMFTDAVDLTELHDMAVKIGMKRSWFQNKSGRPHYDLTPARRKAAIALGAVKVGNREAIKIFRQRDAILRQHEDRD